MPELPEVETVRRDVDRILVGRRIVSAKATGRRSVRRYGDGPAALTAFERDVNALAVTGTRRHGKYLIVDGMRTDGMRTDGMRPDEPVSLVVHLRMSGQLIHSAADAVIVVHTHVRLSLDNGAELRFIDPRTFGEMWLTAPSLIELSHLGPDALVFSQQPRHFADALRARRSKVKALLLDQGFVAGVGNIYSDEILHLAGVRPDKPANEISLQKAMKIASLTGEVLNAAIALRGSSLRDSQYVDVDGNAGNAASLHRVYDHEGQPCSTCGRIIERTQIAGRSSYFCRRCQR